MRILVSISLLITIVFTVGCESEVNLVNPYFSNDPFSPAPLDTVTTTLNGELEIDGDMVEIDTLEWSISDPNGDALIPLSSSGMDMIWSPNVLGVHTVQVKVTSGNKSVTETEQFNVQHSTTSIHRILAGHWHGDGSATWGGGQNWDADFVIQEDGSYDAHITVVHTGDITEVFHSGDDDLSHADKKFTINSIDGNGLAQGIVKTVHSGGDLLTVEIQNLSFNEDYSYATFAAYWGATANYGFTRLD